MIAFDPAALIEAAIAARKRAYAPYSNFAVGAALLGTDGSVFTGSNIENISFGLTICAERSCVYNAVGAGALEFRAIAIVSDSVEPVVPCGACRQVLAEFAPKLDIFCCNVDGKREHFHLETLLPVARQGILG